MPAPIYRVARYDRATRRTLAVCAEGLTMDAASDLAAALRRGEDDEATGYQIQTMTLEEQADLLASGETMAALAEVEAEPEPPAEYAVTYRVNLAEPGRGPSISEGVVARGLCRVHAVAVAAALRQSHPGRVVSLHARGGGAGGTAEPVEMAPEALGAERAVLALRERAADGEPSPRVEVERSPCGSFRATLRAASGEVLDAATVHRPAAPSPTRSTRFGVTNRGDFSRTGAVGRALASLLDVAEGAGFDRAAVPVTEGGAVSPYYSDLAGQREPVDIEAAAVRVPGASPLRLVRTTDDRTTDDRLPTRAA